LINWLVGRSHDAPALPEIKEIPVVTAPVQKLLPFSDDFIIQKKTLPEIIMSPNNLNYDLFKELNPSHVITEGMTAVSGLDEKEVEEMLEEEGFQGIRILDVDPMGLEDIFEDMQRIAGTFGYEHKTEKLVADCRKQLKKTTRRYSIKRNSPVVAVIREWEPLLLSGRWISDLITMCGGIPLIEGGDMYIQPASYFEDIPQILLFGRPQNSLRDNMQVKDILDQLALANIVSCKNPAQKIALDGQAFFNRDCRGLTTALRIIGEIIKKNPKNEELKGVYWDYLK